MSGSFTSYFLNVPNINQGVEFVHDGKTEEFCFFLGWQGP